jgi:hypothetical protein
VKSSQARRFPEGVSNKRKVRGSSVFVIKCTVSIYSQNVDMTSSQTLIIQYHIRVVPGMKDLLPVCVPRCPSRRCTPTRA